MAKNVFSLFAFWPGHYDKTSSKISQNHFATFKNGKMWHFRKAIGKMKNCQIQSGIFRHYTVNKSGKIWNKFLNFLQRTKRHSQKIYLNRAMRKLSVKILKQRKYGADQSRFCDAWNFWVCGKLLKNIKLLLEDLVFLTKPRHSDWSQMTRNG